MNPQLVNKVTYQLGNWTIRITLQELLEEAGGSEEGDRIRGLCNFLILGCRADT